MINFITPEKFIDFSEDSDLSAWLIVNDVVMGGRSTADIKLTKAGHARFSGYVSLANNGGFSSVRYRFQEMAVHQFETIQIRLKGDGNRYQFRVKSDSAQRHSYIAYFDTSGDWETVSIELRTMKPSFRGRALDIPNYPGTKMSELAFLIGNKQEEAFELEIDWIDFK